MNNSTVYPSTQYTQDILQSDLPTSAKLVAIAIADHMHRGAVEAWPSISTLARMASSARSTVQLAIDRLDEDGWIMREKRSKHRSNRYKLPHRYTDGRYRCTDDRYEGIPTVGNEAVNKKQIKNQKGEPTREQSLEMQLSDKSWAH